MNLWVRFASTRVGEVLGGEYLGGYYPLTINNANLTSMDV